MNGAYQCDICKDYRVYPDFVGLSLKSRGIYYFCDECFQRVLTNETMGRREVKFDVNAAVSEAMSGQACEREDCCQRSSNFPVYVHSMDDAPEDIKAMFPEYAASDHPKILPPEDITLTPEQLEMLAPYTVVAGRLE